MIKTQVQIPDYLYAEAKRVASQYEMSLAEVVRRGLERIVVSYPARNDKALAAQWTPPTFSLGLKHADPADLKKALRADEQGRGSA